MTSGKVQFSEHVQSNGMKNGFDWMGVGLAGQNSVDFKMVASLILPFRWPRVTNALETMLGYLSEKRKIFRDGSSRKAR